MTSQADALTDANARIAALEDDIARAEAALNAAVERVEELEHECNDLRAEINEIRPERDAAVERVEQLEDVLKDLAYDIETRASKALKSAKL